MCSASTLLCYISWSLGIEIPMSKYQYQRDHLVGQSTSRSSFLSPKLLKVWQICRALIKGKMAKIWTQLNAIGPWGFNLGELKQCMWSKCLTWPVQNVKKHMRGERDVDRGVNGGELIGGVQRGWSWAPCNSSWYDVKIPVKALFHHNCINQGGPERVNYEKLHQKSNVLKFITNLKTMLNFIVGGSASQAGSCCLLNWI